MYVYICVSLCLSFVIAKVVMARSALILWLCFSLVLMLLLLMTPRPHVSRWEWRATTTTTTAPSSTTGSLERVREEKRIVVASVKDDDTTWLQQRLPEWPVSRYVVDDHEANLTIPFNKGRESMVYLT